MYIVNLKKNAPLHPTTLKSQQNNMQQHKYT